MTTVSDLWRILFCVARARIAPSPWPLPTGHRHLPTLAVLALFVTAQLAWAAPFDRNFTFSLPDGTSITLHGRGDDFSAVFETLDGYTVVFDLPSGFYHYAVRGADGRLASSGLVADVDDPAAAGLAKHIRADAAVTAADRKARAQRWEADTGIRQRWEALKAERRAIEAARGSANAAASPPTGTTVGNKVGLTLLVDFSDQVGTIPAANVDSFANGTGYTGYGNNGSVKEYYYDNSAGLLTYTNVVVGYVRAPQPKTFYDNPNGNPRQFVLDAIAAMQALPNYLTQIVPQLQTLSTDASNHVLAFNIYYAGVRAGPWASGLWPHSWNLQNPVALWQGGKMAYDYQMTDMGNELVLSTFCHENGHMLCGFPDIYDYDYDSTGGAGDFCLMGYGGSDDKNPTQICAYLKTAAGWATNLIDLTPIPQTYTLPPAGTATSNVFLRYRNPTATTEYFLVEHRRKAGRDAALPASGLAIWHVDELGDRDDQRVTPNTQHQNYEVSLEQADNLFHFQNYVNSGDAQDLYYLGNTAASYTNEFNDTSAPSAKWWSGADSELQAYSISAPGATMTVTASAGAPPAVKFSASAYSVNRTAGTATITVVRTGSASSTVTVDYAASNGTGAAGEDYAATSGTLTFGSGQKTNTFTVPILNIIYVPGDKTVNLTLSNPTGGATLGSPSAAVLVIADDRPLPSLSIAGVYLAEGNSGQTDFDFQVNLSQPSSQTITVQYWTTAGTAKPGQDYQTVNGTLTIPPGQPGGTISVPVLGDAAFETDETFTVNLTNATGGTILRGQATGTIHNDDPLPLLSVQDGSGSAPSVTMTIELSAASELPVTVSYMTVDGTAKAGVDYTQTHGTLGIPAGQSTATIGIPVQPSQVYDPGRTFLLKLVNVNGANIGRDQAIATIQSSVPMPSLRIEDASDMGAFLAFPVRLSVATRLPVTVNYGTLDGTATAGMHYTPVSGTLTIPPGQTMNTLVVPVEGRATQDKTMYLKMSDPTNASCTADQAAGIIRAASAAPGNAQPAIGCGAGAGAATLVGFYVLCWAGLAGMKGLARRGNGQASP